MRVESIPHDRGLALHVGSGSFLVQSPLADRALFLLVRTCLFLSRLDCRI